MIEDLDPALLCFKFAVVSWPTNRFVVEKLIEPNGSFVWPNPATHGLHEQVEEEGCWVQVLSHAACQGFRV